jgi:hypothetical protein
MLAGCRASRSASRHRKVLRQDYNVKNVGPGEPDSKRGPSKCQAGSTWSVVCSHIDILSHSQQEHKGMWWPARPTTAVINPDRSQMSRPKGA